MKVALVADVHGNPWALEAVARELREEAPDLTVFLGDAVGLLPVAGETVARLRELCSLGVIGNGDERALAIRDAAADPQTWAEYSARTRSALEKRGVPEADWGPRIEWDSEVVSSLGTEGAAYLRSLPRTVEVALPGGRRMVCFHGTPQDTNQPLYPLAPFEEVDRLLEGVEADVLAFGHFHCPQLRRHRRSMLVNPGSVGHAAREQVFGSRVNPLRAAAEAEYALVRAESASLGIELRRVPYDVGALVAAIRASGAPSPHPRETLLGIYGG